MAVPKQWLMHKPLMVNPLAQQPSLLAAHQVVPYAPLCHTLPACGTPVMAHMGQISRANHAAPRAGGAAVSDTDGSRTSKAVNRKFRCVYFSRLRDSSPMVVVETMARGLSVICLRVNHAEKRRAGVCVNGQDELVGQPGPREGHPVCGEAFGRRVCLALNPPAGVVAGPLKEDVGPAE